MPRLTTAEFADLVRRSRLLDDDQLHDALARFQAYAATLSHQRAADGAEHFARYLVQNERLTEWQAAKLLNKKYRGFFLGKYRLLGQVGRGGMSTVYLAEHVFMHRQVAIKVLPKELVGETSYLARFYLEARAVAALDHPNIVRAYDIDSQDETHYIVMEYVDGRDLHSIVRDAPQPLDCELIAYYVAQAAIGLQHAHEAGLIHRDIKPANLLVDQTGCVKILDLGLARFEDGERGSLTVEHDEQVLGTADYLAPEQAMDSHEVDYKVDIYSLGCTMYFAICGHPPFMGGTLAQKIAKHQSTEPEDLRKERPACPAVLANICRKMMAKEPKDRTASAASVARELSEWLREINSPYTRKLPVSLAIREIRARINPPTSASAIPAPPQLPQPNSTPTPSALSSAEPSPQDVPANGNSPPLPVVVTNSLSHIRGRRMRNSGGSPRRPRTPAWLWLSIAALMLIAAVLAWLHSVTN